MKCVFQRVLEFFFNLNIYFQIEKPDTKCSLIYLFPHYATMSPYYAIMSFETGFLLFLWD